MVAALCVEQRCQPRELQVLDLQMALLQEPIAPSAVIPLFNLSPNHPDWQSWQQYYLHHPEAYPMDGVCPELSPPVTIPLSRTSQAFTGTIQVQENQVYKFNLSQPYASTESISLVTLHDTIHHQLQACQSGQRLRLWGRWNRSGNWLLVERMVIDA
jgi:hypothetical protein